MFRGWEVIYKDGSSIKEGQASWYNVRKIDILKLILHFDNRRWEVSGKQAYTQKKKGSMVPGIQDSFRVESRSIGYYEGNTKVWYTVDESTGIMKISTETN